VPLLQQRTSSPAVVGGGPSMMDSPPTAGGNDIRMQTIATGPVASMVSIKQMASNGGGFFNVNSAHPYECPTQGALFVELLLILMIPSALCYTFGKMLGDTRQGWALWAAMTIIFIPMLWICVSAEQSGNPAFDKMGVSQTATAWQPGGNMEG